MKMKVCQDGQFVFMVVIHPYVSLQLWHQPRISLCVSWWYGGAYEHFFEACCAYLKVWWGIGLISAHLVSLYRVADQVSMCTLWFAPHTIILYQVFLDAGWSIEVIFDGVALQQKVSGVQYCSSKSHKKMPAERDIIATRVMTLAITALLLAISP